VPERSRDDLPPGTGQGFCDYLDLNVEAEGLGFHWSFLVEHDFTGWNQVSATLMLLTCLAMRTTRLRLGSAVIVPCWHNPVLLAEEAATLDLVSGGRLDFRIGKGYRHTEFNGFQVPLEEADARFDEAVEVITRSWIERSRFSAGDEKRQARQQRLDPLHNQSGLRQPSSRPKAQPPLVKLGDPRRAL
jgi:alkanesulfonate monooxygenase SsuD/methylene tetrahydromethanopterin reductase-like flavin-dependent oxidoreductase (luciferase family)